MGEMLNDLIFSVNTCLLYTSIRSAVTYPMIIISMMIVVILVLIIKVMPIFNQVFIQLGSEMSGFSRVLMDLGNTINRYSVVFIAVLAVIVIGFFAYNHTAKGAAFLRGLGSHIPAIRRMHHDIASCRFASGMALTLKSGMAPDVYKRQVETKRLCNLPSALDDRIQGSHWLLKDHGDLIPPDFLHIFL